MKTTNSKVICHGELHRQSLLHAFAFVPVEQLKIIAQKFREGCDWYGRNTSQQYGIMHDCAVDVIQIVEPKFTTDFIPAK